MIGEPRAMKGHFNKLNRDEVDALIIDHRHITEDQLVKLLNMARDWWVTLGWDSAAAKAKEASHE